MLVTEEEAKTKWCPNARATLYARGNAPNLPEPINIIGHGSNRIATDDVEIDGRIAAAIDGTLLTRCIGSQCMAWRWFAYGHPDAPRSGYCGAANGAVMR